MGKIVNIKERSVTLLFFSAILIPALVVILSLFRDFIPFEFVDRIPEIANSVGVMLIGVFIMFEIGIKGMFTKKKLRQDPLRLFGLIVAFIVVLLGASATIGIESAFLATFSGLFVFLGLIYAVSEGFRV